MVYPVWPRFPSLKTCLLGQVMPPPSSVARLDSQADRIGTGAHAKRGKDGGAMHLHRPLAEAQFIGNLLVERACRQVQQDFALAGG